MSYRPDLTRKILAPTIMTRSMDVPLARSLQTDHAGVEMGAAEPRESWSAEPPSRALPT